MPETIPFPYDALQKLLPLAFDEDIGSGDITSRATIPESFLSTAVLVAKEPGIIAGLPLIEAVFKFRNCRGDFRQQIREGQKVNPDTEIYIIHSQTRHILQCERIILNFLQRMCGIATRAHTLQQLVKKSPTRILDTRKTLPGFRQLDKYAVRIGGAANHRMGLYDHILIKDNHIQACGGAREAVAAVYEKYGETFTIEAEVKSLPELESLLESRVNWIMLDNMSVDEMQKAVRLARRRAPHIKLEASGNMDARKVKQLSDIGLDFISIGELTHSVKALDLSLQLIQTQ
jgi:nicotinate-nucleotide pyrophosphorylase (carboxylating)